MADQETVSDQGTERSEASSETAPSPSARDEAPERDATPASSDASWLASDRAQTLANVLTIIVALAAIGLSVWEGLENRWHNRLSVLPHLKPIEATLSSATPIEHEAFLLPMDIDSLYTVGYALENSGLGPAVLKNVLIFKGDQKVYDSAQSDSMYYFHAIERDLDQLPFGTGLLKSPYFAGDMLKAGEVHRFATVIIPFSAVNSDSLDRWPPEIVQDKVLDGHSFVFCYCSVYGEDCDMTHLGAKPPVEDVCGF